MPLSKAQDHGRLLGLTDDDHAQYARVDGTRAYTGNQSMGSNKITSLATPTASTDAATKGYVDGVAQGLDAKASVRVATAVALPAYTRTASTITASANGALADVDGVTLVEGDRLLLKDGAAGADNGIYVVTDVGDGGSPFVLDRTDDANADADVTTGMYCWVEEGTANADSGWVLSTDNPITLNTTSLTFVQFTGAYQLAVTAPLSKSGNTLSYDALPDLQWVDTTSAPQTVNLDAVSGWDANVEVIVQDIGNNAATNNISVTPNGADYINGVNAAVLIQVDGGAVRLRKQDANNWRIVGSVG